MSKQTAVEWLIKKLTNRQNGIFDGFQHLSLDEIYNQAKAMEREQIIDAWNGGDYAYFYSKETGRDFSDGEEYYNETYGGDHIGEVNKMIDHVPAVGKMVEDVEKLAEKYPYGGREGSKRLAFIDGYNTAKETLYTEEQVREVIRNCFKSNAIGFLVTEDDMMRTIKQPKQ